ncbi:MULTISPECIES: class I SAM-dependent DNA methyltransferase [unclassified Streptomyces]|uniref:class I SAM-dependent DNA methyltransferase n=1 Tax=unclassified Streptomyces TaxID=2593676 RepID=UPI0029BF6481|nr:MULTISPECIES: class I SAM-dependent DNA methyltransferase [unclassified Streptomyces]MDX3766472.1 class I SAM-dependent DNA methyltransferase [Streptomyces sp. AK08-01B]MDX3816271.1 class I SAM-dependent DNA methyltransferase [Streptomyces sp. AK08-01A]
MIPGQKKPTDQAELFSASTAKEIQDILWKAADKLRGSIDAAQYKEFVLGLIFLKYISDAFEERRTELAKELAEDGIAEDRLEEFLEDRDEYSGAHVFWVPETARWSWIAANGKSQGVGKLLDDAMDAVMRENAALTGVLPKIFNRDNVDQKRLSELVDLISDARFGGSEDKPAQDVLGEVYEYFLGNFARAEGKRGGEFYTPRSVVQLIVEILEPYEGRVYDPACGSGGMFVQAGKFIEAHRGRGHKADLSVYGQELNERTWRLGKMNLAIHGIDGNLAPRWGDTFAEDKHPDLKADFVMANPPFNIKDWARDENDPRWKFGVPPRNNANYAWLQHMISKLGEKGTAGIVLANGSMSSQQSGEGEIRQALVEADLVACMVALPSQLFRTTQIPACLWFLAKDKSPQGARRLNDRRSEILFIDARGMGEMIDRTERNLTGADLAKIAGAYHAWRGTASAREAGLAYENEPGFCFSADLATVREHGYVLTPGRYVGAVEAEEEDAEAVAERIAALTEELYRLFEKSAELDTVVREQLEGIG